MLQGMDKFGCTNPCSMKTTFKCIRCDKHHQWNHNVIFSDLPILDKVRDALCTDCSSDLLLEPDYREIYNLYADMFKARE